MSELKTWQCGAEDIEPFMPPIAQALSRHIKEGDAWSDIYNRAYEAVCNALDSRTQPDNPPQWKRDAYNEMFANVPDVKPMEPVDDSPPSESRILVWAAWNALQICNVCDATKLLKQAMDLIDKQPDNPPLTCETCQYKDRSVDIDPCKHCREAYLSKYAHRKDGGEG